MPSALPATRPEAACFAVQPILPLHPAAGPPRVELLARDARSGSPVATERLERARRVHLLDLAALATAADLRRRAPGLPVHVNVSTRTLDDPCAARAYLAALRVVAAPGLVLEVTETALPRDTGAVVRTLASARALGCAVALDDVVCGRWPAPLLGRVTVDVVKLDGRRLADRAAAEAVAREAHAHGALAVAEWVEHPVDLRRARSLGFDLAQGFLLGRPEGRLRRPPLLAAAPAPRRLRSRAHVARRSQDLLCSHSDLASPRD